MTTSRVQLATTESIARAAELLRAGALVAFPTETVYGIGANALNPAGVRRIFAAKGRPATNPIIVHIGDVSQLSWIVTDIPPIAFSLAERFWPGPLTLVLPRGDNIPDEVTAGGPTVAVRIPAHPVARSLLAAAGIPLAAPSANRSTGLSPTTAAHVLASLGEAVDLILDGGACPGGIESTVLDVTTTPPQLLRPGPITAAMIEAVTGPLATTVADTPIARSPGQMARHYAPRTPLELSDGDGRDRVMALVSAGKKVGWLTWPEVPEVSGAIRKSLPYEPIGYAAGLYAALHELDGAGCDRIVAARPPAGPEWLAVHDRLNRAREP